jgi:hypothetical protein
MDFKPDILLSKATSPRSADIPALHPLRHSSSASGCRFVTLSDTTQLIPLLYYANITKSSRFPKLAQRLVEKKESTLNIKTTLKKTIENGKNYRN